MTSSTRPSGTAPAAPVPSRVRSGRAPGSTSGTARRLLDWRVRFAALALVWGFSFLFIKLGTQAFAPLQVALGRMVFGAAVLAAALAVKRERLPGRPLLWAHLTVSAFFLNTLPYSLFAYAELTVSSSLAGICNATSPLFGMLLSLVALSEDRPGRRKVAGLVTGFGGVLVVLGAWRGFSGQDPAGTAMALGAAASYAVGWLYVRRTLAGSPHSALSMSGGQLLLGSAQLLVLTALFTSAPAAFPAGPVLAVLALGALGTGLAFLIQYGLVAEVGPTTGQMVTYFIPVIATAAGVTLLGEPLTWNTPVGALIVLLGAALTQSAPRRRKRETTANDYAAQGTCAADGAPRS
ncbi:drug/metabolite transporter (DMT)-like permease [Streptomyces sp. Amel2xB2]|uniref:DMT family transporter n=1 Tax=Streptomyces sp. Amel2xB2 TaxID=1305829 RepID=UPI000DB980F0|nr:DMT family transporter [Streptomyces sp. Amel2xB2]RAJ57506.1 drug/metabolite transporter (DMT)-like permease [Streptomyces sp. Amel2xB2]